MAGHHEELKRAIRTARSQADIRSDMELSLRAGVHLQTLQNWMSGKTTPRPSELSKVAHTLGLSLADLMAVYEGREPEPQPLQDAVRELVVTVQSLVDELRQERLSPGDSTPLRAARDAAPTKLPADHPEGAAK